MYRTQSNNWITSGQAKMLPPEEKNNRSSLTNYISLHGVLNIKKLDRASFVFDVSAKINKICLNDNLLPGIDLLINLAPVLTKLRNGKYVIIGDTEKMFHHVFLDRKDIEIC